MHHHSHHHDHHQALPRHGAHLVARSPPRRPDIVPRSRQPYLLEPEPPTLVKREPLPASDSDSTSTSTQTCGADNSGHCEKPTSSTTTTTLPVVLGAVVPIVCAIILLIYLHRRNVRKLRNEDANDKHKSLDFGLDLGPASGGKSMRQTEKLDGNYNHAKGVSLDIGPNPYMLPPGLQGSKDSLHSLTRNIGAGDDKYRGAVSYMGGDGTSVRSHPRGFPDDASSYAGSTKRGALGEDMNSGLLRNAQRMSRSSPPLYNSPPNVDSNKEHDIGFQMDLPRSPSPVLIPGAPTINEPTPKANSAAHNNPEDRPNFPFQNPLPNHFENEQSILTPRISLPMSDAASDYGDNRQSNAIAPVPTIHGAENVSKPGHGAGYPMAPVSVPEEPPHSQHLSVDPRRDTRRMTLGLRPLPPEDPADNPEQRANRIRSFYKEYFDESKGNRETYYEDYGPEVYPDDSYAFDPVTGEYYDAVPAPFAEPVTRRAMTPPPRAPPRFQGAARHGPSGSMGGFSDRSGPRAFSSASNRMPAPRGPRKPAPPPAPLQILPTPHMLNDESLMGAIDYAPGPNSRDRREGRPETPLGGLRPFSPTLRAHTPLASAFNELSAMPSAHALRKSGTYDNLDFAPPPRFKNTDTASDAGSIRSNGTGISTTHLHNIRTGAYRVSRLPTDTVGTRDDLASNLRPKWDIRQ